MHYAWDQCDHCGKLGSALDLNELGLCPECAADDTLVAAKEQTLLNLKKEQEQAARVSETPALCMICGRRPSEYSCDHCGASVCSQHAASIDADADGNIRDVMCADCYDASD
jgi:HIT zinc finger